MFMLSFIVIFPVCESGSCATPISNSTPARSECLFSLKYTYMNDDHKITITRVETDYKSGSAAVAREFSRLVLVVLARLNPLNSVYFIFKN